MTPHSDEEDDDLPLGDGTAATEAEVTCPYCSEEQTITLDPGSGDHQQYVEDCQICCRPWTVFVTYDVEGQAEVALEPADEGDGE
jgi:transposase-like protein